jgi:hypothetical protein
MRNVLRSQPPLRQATSLSPHALHCRNARKFEWAASASLFIVLASSNGCYQDTSNPVSAPRHARSSISSSTTQTTAYVAGSGLTALNYGGSEVSLASWGTVSWGLALTPDGKTAFVTIDPDILRAYDIASGNVLAERDLFPGSVGGTAPVVGVAVTPDGRNVLVATTGPVGVEGSLHILDAATLNDIVVIPGVGYNPNPIVLSPDARYAFIGDRSSDGSITKVDLFARQVVGRAALPGGGTDRANSIAVSADGSTVFATHMNSNQLQVIDAATMTVSRTLGTCVVSGCTGAGPKGVALSPDESLLYITYRSGFLEIRRISDFSLVRAQQLSGSTAALDAVAITKDGQLVFVSSVAEGTVSVLNAAGDVLEVHAIGAAMSIALLESNPGATTAGSDITVTPIDPTTGTTPITLTFSSVTGAGSTTVTSSGAGAVPPSGFQLGDSPVYYEVHSTATFAGSVSVCFSYTPTDFQNANNLRLFHGGSSGDWTDVTTSNDASAGIICGSVTSFSPFMFAERRYNFTGFFQPVDNSGSTGVMNTLKAGSAVPVKFSLGSNLGLDVLAMSSPVSSAFTCTGNVEDAIEVTVAAGASSFSYDATAGQYVYVWKTDKAWSGTCRKLTVTLKDGTVHQALFKFTR